MPDFSHGTMLTDASNAARKHSLPVQIGIFILVYLAVSYLSGQLLTLPLTIWALQQMPAAIESPQMLAELIANLTADMPDWLFVVQLFIAGVQIACAIAYCRLIEKRSLRSMGFCRRAMPGRYAAGLLLGAAQILVAGALCCTSGNLRVSLSSAVSPMIALFFVGYLVQGLSEEVLLRGYFMVSLSSGTVRRTAAPTAVLISSLVFAAMHLMNPGVTPLAFLNLVLAGVFYALLVLRTDQIWTAAAAHSAWNFVQGNVIGISVSGMQSTSSVLTAEPIGNALVNGGSFGLEGGLAVTAVMCISILMLIFWPQRQKTE